MALIDFIGSVHTSTARDYLGRVNGYDKAEAASVAIRFDYDYWDGDRRFGYGGYHYDGRWRKVAQAMADHYHLRPGARILDVGCGKGFLLHEFTQLVPGCRVTGLDISAYALENAKPEVKENLVLGHARALPWEDRSFDLVVSVNALHNLPLPDLALAVGEIERVGREAKHITVEAYETERQKVNLMYWQLTCRSFFQPAEWEWVFAQAGYGGDWGYITFD